MTRDQITDFVKDLANADVVQGAASTMTGLIERVSPAAMQQLDQALQSDVWTAIKRDPDVPAMIMAGFAIWIIYLIRTRRRRAKLVACEAMVIPAAPELASAPRSADGAFGKLELTSQVEKLLGLGQSAVSAARAKAAFTKPADTGTYSFVLRPALSPDEARLRGVVHAALADFDTPYQVMARTALSAILAPAPDVTGAERARARAALDTSHLDLGVFDRAGRLVLALEIRPQRPIVEQALAQNGITTVRLTPHDGAAQVRSKLMPFLGKHATLARTATARPARPGRPQRPQTPANQPSANDFAAL